MSEEIPYEGDVDLSMDTESAFAHPTETSRHGVSMRDFCLEAIMPLRDLVPGVWPRWSILRGCTLAVLVSAATACASREVTHVEPSAVTVTSRLEATNDGRGQYVVVENQSSVPIFVTSVQLRDCQNIRNPCYIKRMRVEVRPGLSKRVLTVQSRSAGNAYNFRYSWSWEGMPGSN